MVIHFVLCDSLHSATMHTTLTANIYFPFKTHVGWKPPFQFLAAQIAQYFSSPASSQLIIFHLNTKANTHHTPSSPCALPLVKAIIAFAIWCHFVSGTLSQNVHRSQKNYFPCQRYITSRIMNSWVSFLLLDASATDQQLLSLSKLRRMNSLFPL